MYVNCEVSPLLSEQPLSFVAWIAKGAENISFEILVTTDMIASHNGYNLSVVHAFCESALLAHFKAHPIAFSSNN